MTRNELEAHYRRYIACLNERRIDDAEQFYTDELLYNGKRVTRAEWRATAIEKTFDAIPDLQWHIEQLVIEGEYIAARLVDTGTFKQELQGIEPTGDKATFGENVFYRFRGHQTDEVWSVVDVSALAGKSG